MNSRSPFVPLDQPPQAISLTIRALLQRVHQGKVRVPSFQRPLRWRPDDVVKLFDSIQRGYPVGALLFWKRDAPSDPNYRIGNAPFPVEAAADAWWIVDGQQRVTALAAALLELDHRQDPRWLVKYDPARGEFLPGPLTQEESGRIVPLSALGDLRRLGRWIQTATLDGELIDRVEAMQQRILDYGLSAYVVETGSPEALEGVFARMNSTGVRMRSDEVFQALFAQKRSGRAGVDLNVLQRSCDVDSFGEPPRSELLKAVLAMSGQDPTRRLEVLGEEAASALVGMTQAEEALALAVRFLQASPEDVDPGAGIPCYAFLPYPTVFIILARWFHLHPGSSAATRRLLARWLWRGVVTGVHERAAVSGFRHQVKLLKGESEQDDVDALLASVGEPVRVDWTLRPFHVRNAASRTELLALLSLGPRDRNAPVSWRALVSGGQRVAREIVASPEWKGLAPDDASLARTAANRALLDTSGTGLKAELRRWNPSTDAESLESHLIDAAMWHDLNEGRIAEFLQRRATRVQSLVSAFLTARAGIGAPRLAAVDRYAETEADLDEADASWHEPVGARSREGGSS